VWHIADEEKKAATHGFAKSPTLNHLDNSEQHDHEHHDYRPGFVCKLMDRFVVDPTSPKRIVWDLFSLYFVIYDLLTVPLIVFEFDENDFAGVMRIATMLFWTFDIAASCFTGYQGALGKIELHWHKVLVEYAKKRFAFDFVVVLMDWLMFLSDMSSFASLFRLGKAVRVTRVMRIFRMLRLARLQSILSTVNSHLTSPLLNSFLNIVSLIFCVMVINHFFGCGWYGVGMMGSRESWIHLLDAQGASMLERYLASYQWSLAQFTPAPTDVQPVNTGERLYAIFILFLGLVVYSALLGNVTATINHARADAFKKMVENSLLRTFLAEKHVTDELSHGITLFLKDKGIVKKRTAECDVMLIEHLPRHLREELHYQVYTPNLSKHTFFDVCDTIHHDAMVCICHEATQEKVLAKGEEPIYYGKKGSAMLFPIAGVLHYFGGPHREHLVDDKHVVIGLGGWTTEAPLWIRWEHRGLLSAHDLCDVVEIESYNFRKVMSRQGSALAAFRRYAEFYVKTFVQAAEEGSDVDDLWGTPAQSTPGTFLDDTWQVEKVFKG
jgi:hypothetical protein